MLYRRLVGRRPATRSPWPRRDHWHRRGSRSKNESRPPYRYDEARPLAPQEADHDHPPRGEDRGTEHLVQDGPTEDRLFTKGTKPGPGRPSGSPNKIPKSI